MSIELPTKPEGPDNEDPRVLVLYGPVKVGKTTFVSKLNNALLIDLEKGSGWVSAVKVRVPDKKTLDEIGQKIVEAGYPYKYGIVDTVTAFEEIVKPEAKRLCKKTPLGSQFEKDDVNDILDLPNGGGWRFFREAFINYIEGLKNLFQHVIFVGHLKLARTDKSGSEVTSKDLDLSGKLKNVLTQEADAIGLMHQDEDSNLLINFKTSDEVSCGSRPSHLANQDIKVAEYDPQNNDIKNVRWDRIFTEESKKRSSKTKSKAE